MSYYPCIRYTHKGHYYASNKKIKNNNNKNKINNRKKD